MTKRFGPSEDLTSSFSSLSQKEKETEFLKYHTGIVGQVLMSSLVLKAANFFFSWLLTLLSLSIGPKKLLRVLNKDRMGSSSLKDVGSQKLLHR